MESTQHNIPENDINFANRVTVVIGRNQFAGNWHEEDFGTSLNRYEEVGFVAKEAARTDEVILIFPEGWTSVISPVSKWTSYLYDAKGQFRGTIDFKDYFGNKTYVIRPASRITLFRKYDIYYRSNTYDVREYPGENILFTPTIPEGTPDWKIFSMQEKMCKEYLNEKFPGWKDPFTHW